MAHNINYNSKKGTYSFVSHKEKAWHGLGTIVNNAMTSAEAIELANLDYDIDTTVTAALFKDDDKTRAKVMPNNYAIYRTDTRDIFGTVTDRYQITQNRDVFKFMDSIVGEGKAIYETAGALGKGETVFITAKLPYYIRVNGHDTIENYLVVSNGHNGKTSLNIFLTPVRVVCENTLAVGLNNAKFNFSLRHTQGINDKLEDASQILEISKTITLDMQEKLKFLSTIKITDEKVDSYFKELVLSNAEMQQLLTADIKLNKAEFISTRKKNIINDLHKYYVIGVGQDGIQGTAYGAYNAINGYMSNVKKYKDNNAKMASLVLGGKEFTMNNKALQLATMLG